VNSDPHRGQPILRRGPDPATARLTILCVHGRGASAADILAGAQRYATDRASQDPKYTRYPTTWLNQECWTDEPAPDPALRLFEVHDGGAPRTEGRRLNQCDSKIASFRENCRKMGIGS